MGIYLPNMEMPKSCYVCPFCDYVSARCDAVKGNPYTPESVTKNALTSALSSPSSRMGG